MSITVIVPNNDLVALAEAGDMLLRIARQKARTLDNESYIADAMRAEKERVAAGLHGGVMTADAQVDAYQACESAIATECGCAYQDAPEVIDAAAAFSGAPLQTVNVIPPAPVEHGVVSVPPTPVDISAPSTTAVELDSRGLPWDRRIHSATRNKCKTGEWKNIKGVDKDLLASVENELRTAMASAGTVTQAAVTPELIVQTVISTVPQPVVPTPPAATLQAGDSVVLPNGQAGVLSPPVVSPAPAPAGCPASFPEFLQIVTGKCTARVLSYDEVTKTCQAHGLAGIPLLSARPDLIPTIYAELEALWLSRS